MESNLAALKVEGLESGYGSRKILKGVSLHLEPGEIVAVIGPNGSGKSTLLKTLFGLLPIWSGVVSYAISPTTLRPRHLLRLGVSYSPQGSRVFSGLTVIENLRLASHILDRWEQEENVARILCQFPVLAQRRQQMAGTLSGGEKQTLALGCATMVAPRVLLLDEPSLGLAPALVGDTMKELKRVCVEAGAGCLLVEQKVKTALGVSDRVYVLKKGEVVFAGDPSDLRSNDRLRELFL